jgi:hypothetical protein
LVVLVPVADTSSAAGGEGPSDSEGEEHCYMSRKTALGGTGLPSNCGQPGGRDCPDGSCC